jgi:hypothetical protein
MEESTKELKNTPKTIKKVPHRSTKYRLNPEESSQTIAKTKPPKDDKSKVNVEQPS